MATIKDIAKQANVSPGTVSRALNPKKSHFVAEETVTKIKAIAETLNYAPNPKTLTKAAQLAFAIVTPLTIAEEAEDTYWRFIRSGIHEAARAESIQVDDTFRTSEVIDLEALINFDAVIVMGSLSKTALKKIKTYNSNLIVVDGGGTHYDFADTLEPNLYELTFKILDKMAATFSEPILFIGGSRNECNLDGTVDRTTEDLRTKAYHDWILQHNRQPLIALCPWNSEGGYQAAKNFFAKNPPTIGGILAGSDPIAIGVMKYLQEQHLTPGKDIALASFDDVEVAQYLTPALTSIWLPKNELGMAAVLHSAVVAKTPKDYVVNSTIPGKINFRDTFKPLF